MSSGAVANVCVGTMDSPMEPGRVLTSEETGCVVGAKTESSTGLYLLRTKSTSSGPKASRTWKPSNRAMAYLLGGGMAFFTGARFGSDVGRCDDEVKRNGRR